MMDLAHHPHAAVLKLRHERDLPQRPRAIQRSRQDRRAQRLKAGGADRIIRRRERHDVHGEIKVAVIDPTRLGQPQRRRFQSPATPRHLVQPPRRALTQGLHRRARTSDRRREHRAKAHVHVRLRRIEAQEGPVQRRQRPAVIEAARRSGHARRSRLRWVFGRRRRLSEGRRRARQRVCGVSYAQTGCVPHPEQLRIIPTVADRENTNSQDPSIGDAVQRHAACDATVTSRAGRNVRNHRGTTSLRHAIGFRGVDCRLPVSRRGGLGRQVHRRCLCLAAVVVSGAGARSSYTSERASGAPPALTWSSSGSCRPSAAALDPTRSTTMELRPLGRTGVQGSSFCLGAMMFGAWGNPDHDESIKIIHAALHAGINFIDTADVYGAGESEEIVGRALARGRRDDVVLATKFHNPMGEDPNRRGNSRRWIARAVEDSLRRLGTDWIDLYQVHRPDPDTDIEETLSALTDLVHQGKVRYLGASTFPASQIVEAQWVARDRRLERFVTEQPAYSILVRAIEGDILPTCARHGMGVLSYSPLTGGWLSGRWRKAAGQQASSRAGRLPERFDLSDPLNQRKLDAVEALAELADEAGLTLIQVAIAFVLDHPAITAAIVGPRTMEQLEGQLAAADIVLETAVLDRIDEIVAPGTTINPVDNSFENPSLEPEARRR